MNLLSAYRFGLLIRSLPQNFLVFFSTSFEGSNHGNDESLCFPSDFLKRISGLTVVLSLSVTVTSKKAEFVDTYASFKLSI